MIAWPEPLVREIAKGRCVIFLGSGVSATAEGDGGRKSPTWDEFLKLACDLVADADAKAAIEVLIAEGKMLVALQAIRDNCNRAEYRALLDKNFNDATLKPSRLHEIIFDLDARIVITTNFDKIYERYCNRFTGSSHAYKTIHYNAEDLADEIRSDTRLIIKAHGSIDNIKDMIFTRAQYHAAKKSHPHFYEVLKAVFLTSTILFLGCGLEDPDIMLLLEDVKVVGQHEQPHYAMALSGAKNRFLIKDWEETYNIKVLEFGPTYADMAADLQALLDKVESERSIS